MSKVLERKRFFSDSFGKKEYKRLFLLGALFGALLFVLIYGVEILNPTYIGWIFCGDNDLKQHYAGWCHYRMSPWHFPIGLIDTLSYPTSISVIYTDSIPLMAFICKLFSPVLPQNFQYFGVVGLLSFALSGGTSAVLLKRFIGNPWMCILLSSLFTVNFPIMQRMFYHTALSAHWLIFAAFILWAYDNYSVNCLKSCIYWGILGALAVSIHPYYIPMLGMILVADRICFFVFSDKKIIQALVPVLSYCATAVLVLWIFGGFYGSSTAVGFGLGTFGANFNTFINPINYGVILPDMGLQNYFQYEGCGYIGAGLLALSIFVDVMLIVRRKEHNFTKNAKVHGIVLAGLFVCSFAVATLPKLSIGVIDIGQIPYPEPIYRLFSIFRSNGRFIWPAMYILMMAIVVYAYRYLKSNPKIMIAVFAAVILIQGVDLSKQIGEKREYYYAHHDMSTIWDEVPKLSMMAAGKKHFVFLYDENDINMDTSFYAYEHGMTLSNFYFARDINDEVLKTINAYMGELSKNMVRDDSLYIMKTDYYMSNKNFIDSLDAEICRYEDHIFMIAD